MKRPLAYITAAWLGGDSENAEQAARYCRAVYEAGFSPICPPLYLPLFLNDAVPEEHKSGIDMGRDLLRRSHVLVVCGHTMTEAMKNDIAVAQRLGITATTLEGIPDRQGTGQTLMESVLRLSFQILPFTVQGIWWGNAAFPHQHGGGAVPLKADRHGRGALPGILYYLL